MSAGLLPQPSSVNAVPELGELLQRCQRRWRFQTLVRGLADMLLVVGSLVLVLGLLDFLVVLPIAGRVVAWCLFVCVCSVTAWKRLVAPLRLTATNEELGAAIDLAFPEFQESFATVLSLNAADTSGGEAGSMVMRQHVAQDVHARLKQVATSAVLNSSVMLRRCGLAGLAAMAIVIPCSVWPDGSWLVFQRLMLPLANLESATDFYFEVPEANRVVAMGSAVDFIAIPRWRSQRQKSLPAHVRLELQSHEGRSDSLPLAYDDIQNQFQTTLPAVQQSLQYRFVSGRVKTAWFDLTVADPPRITALQLHETPPAYTGRPDSMVEAVVGDIEVFEYSEIEIRLQFSKPVQTASLQWITWQPITSMIAEDEFVDAAAAIPEERLAAAVADDQTLTGGMGSSDLPVLVAVLNAERTEAMLNFQALGSGQFEFRIVDDSGLSIGPEPVRRLIVTEDKAPVVKVTGLRAETEVRPDDIVPLNAVVTDDLGIAAVELRVQKNQEAIRIVPAESLQPGVLSTEQQFRLPLRDYELQENDTVSLTIRALDARPVPGPNLVDKGPWLLRIRSDAQPLGKQPLSEKNQSLIDSLKRLAEALTSDIETGNTLRNQIWKNWDAGVQDEIRQLSEKEQLQGRELQQLAQEIADHPLMNILARDLQDVGSTVRSDVPQLLNQALAAQRDDAAKSVQDGMNQLTGARDQLRRNIQELETLARIEQDLTELNRLALEAEELARRSRELDRDRQQKQPEPGQSQEELQRALGQESQEIVNEQQELARQLESLLNRQKELLAAARRAQLDRLSAAASEAENLARAQQRVADAVAEESRDAARDTAKIAEQLEQLKSSAEQLSKQLEQEPGQKTPIAASIADDAARALRQGDLQDARQAVSDLQDQLNAAVTELQLPEGSRPDPDSANSTPPQVPSDPKSQNAEHTAKLSAEASQLKDQLRSIQEHLQNLIDERNPALENAGSHSVSAEESAVAGQAAPGSQAESVDQAAKSDQSGQTHQAGQNPQSTAEVVNRLMQRLEQLQQASDAIAQSLLEDKTLSSAVTSPAENAAKRAQEASSMAQAGQFAAAANAMREAGQNQQQASAQISSDQHPDQKLQLESLSEELTQLAGLFQQLHQDNAAQAQVQRNTQSAISQDAQALTAELAELAERMNLDALGLQPQSRQAGAAAQSAAEAAETTLQSSAQLQDSQLRQAAQSGHQAAGQLNRAAQLAQQGASEQPESNPAISNEVGDSVTDALSSLRQAAQAAQQSAVASSEAGGTKPGSGDDGSESAAAGDADSSADNAQSQHAASAGEGQDSSDGNASGGQSNSSESGASGQASESSGKPGGTASAATEALAGAAEALANAARGALPAEFTPGQLNDASGSSGRAQAGTGNDQGFDGRTPDSTRRNGRRWLTPGPHDELDDPLSDAGGEVVDNEYAELIRNYRRQLANVGTSPDDSSTSTGSKDTKPKP